MTETASPQPTIDHLINELSLEEKVLILSGVDAWYTPPVERLGIGALKVTDGPVGARGDSTTGARSVNTAATISLAATFDSDLAGEIGQLLGRETARKGAQVLLAPTINLARHPLGGRNFECFGEDPHLTTAMAVSYIAGVQQAGVGACAKHLIANDVEYSRMTVSSEIDERTLREVYLRPFKAVVDAGVWTVMAAYPKLNGIHCTEHQWLLTDLLRTEWGFDGLVMSDWGATLSTTGSINAGLDLEMPGPSKVFGTALVAAVENGDVTLETLNERVARVLQLSLRSNRLGAPGAPPTVPAEQTVNLAEEQALVRRAAATGMVLLRNDGLLPLKESATGGRAPRLVDSVALIGPNAHPGTIQGGGSAAVPAHYRSSPLEALSAIAEVNYHPAIKTNRYLPAPGTSVWNGPVLVERFADSHFGSAGGTTVSSQETDTVSYFGQRPLKKDFFSQRAVGEMTIGQSGSHRFGLYATGQARVLVNGQLVVDNWISPQPGQAMFGYASAEVVSEVELAAGTTAEVVVEWSTYDDAIVAIHFGYLPPIDADAELDAAVELAADADVAVVVVGLDSEWETEGHDRHDMNLPGRSDELVQRVAAVNDRTMVIVNAGSPVSMPWFDDVAAVLMAWYPGQEFGNAIADIVSGVVEPGGRLPLTWPRSIDDTPFVLPAEQSGPRPSTTTMEYEEGLLIGYRSYDARSVEPLAEFGFGLGYTTFELSDASQSVADDGGVDITVSATNTGDRQGKCVVQAYLELPAGDGRPLRTLAGFRAKEIEPGATETLQLSIGPEAFEQWSTEQSQWLRASGPYSIQVGFSSRDLPITL